MFLVPSEGKGGNRRGCWFCTIDYFFIYEQPLSGIGPLQNPVRLGVYGAREP